MLILVVSDTSDRTRLGQKPSLARGFVGVSNSTITSFSWLLIEIDTPVPNELGASATTAQGRSRAASPQHQFGKGGDRFLPNKAKKCFVFMDDDYGTKDQGSPGIRNLGPSRVAGESSSQRPAAAKPSSPSREVPLQKRGTEVLAALGGQAGD
jgi:hypothetical protein